MILDGDLDAALGSKRDKRVYTFCTREIAKCDQTYVTAAHAAMRSGGLKLGIRVGLGVCRAAVSGDFASGPDAGWPVFRW